VRENSVTVSYSGDATVTAAMSISVINVSEVIVAD
jgi:hypothetical protein